METIYPSSVNIHTTLKMRHIKGKSTEQESKSKWQGKHLFELRSAMDFFLFRWILVNIPTALAEGSRRREKLHFYSANKVAIQLNTEKLFTYGLLLAKKLAQFVIQTAVFATQSPLTKQIFKFKLWEMAF